MKIITARRLTDEQAESLQGTQLKEEYPVIGGEDAEVFKPNGELLFRLRSGVVPAELCATGYRALRSAAKETRNRGAAAGLPDLPPGAEPEGRFRFRPRKRDGELSERVYAKAVNSGVVGHVDRYATYPYCRQTAWTMEKPELFYSALPFIQFVDKLFSETLPDRYAAQRAMIERTHPHFVIHGTSFTTITVNKNWSTAVHKDRGDLREGFGVMAAFRAGTFKGCNFVFPQYGIAVEMGTGDVLFADVHEWHGNTPIVGIPGRYERLSLVMYYRSKMIYCGSAEEELELAKRREAGTPLSVRPETLNEEE